MQRHPESQHPRCGQCPLVRQNRRIATQGSRVALALFLAVVGMAMAHAGNANCPTQPCKPPRNDPAHDHPPLNATSYAHTPTTTYAKSPPHPIVKEKVPGIGPVAPGPTHALSGAPNTANKQGIIFVGGKNALNPQPIPPGHAAQASVIAPNAKLKPVAPKPVPKPGPVAH